MCEMEESGIDNPDDYLVFKGDKLTAAKLEFLRETINSIS